MRTVLAAALALVAGSLSALDPPSKPAAEPDRIDKLVRQLGSPNYQLREAAVRELVAIGPDVLPAVAAATRSADPEVARRAADVYARVGRQAANDRLLAPTTVDLAANDTLQHVLDGLAKQSGYPVKLAGPRAAELAAKRVSVRTGAVPFWAAVRAVCDAADLRLAAAGGFYAPGSVFDAPHKPAFTTQYGIHLEPRNGAKPRPAAVYRAVMVEAFEVPAVAAVPGAAVAVLQVWPEPKLGWQETAGLRGARVTTADGRTLTADTAGPARPPQVTQGNGVRFVGNANGQLVLVNDKARVPLPASGPFTPNARQVLVRVPADGRPVASAKVLAGSVVGTVRAGPEPVASVRLAANGTTAEATGAGGLEFHATRAVGEGNERRLFALLRFDPARVDLAGASEVLPGTGPPGPAGNGTVYGIRVTDADGRPFVVTLKEFAESLGGEGRPNTITVNLALTPTARGQGEPHAAAVWGHYNRPVDVPFTLADVPLAGGPP